MGLVQILEMINGLNSVVVFMICQVGKWIQEFENEIMWFN